MVMDQPLLYATLSDSNNKCRLTENNDKAPPSWSVLAFLSLSCLGPKFPDLLLRSFQCMAMAFILYRMKTLNIRVLTSSN